MRRRVRRNRLNSLAMGTVQGSGGSCRISKGRVRISDPVKSMPKPGTECAVVDGTTDLEQQIGAPSRPSHLLRFIHAPVDQEVGCALGDRRSDAQTGTVSFGIVDQPCGLASEVFIDRMQRVPQLARRHAPRALAVLAFEDMHTLRIRLMLRWAFFALPFQIRQCRRSTSATIVAFAFTRSGSFIDKFAAASFVCCKRIAI